MLRRPDAPLTLSRALACSAVRACTRAGQQSEDEQSSFFYMGVYSAISGLQLLLTQANYLSTMTAGLRAGR